MRSRSASPVSGSAPGRLDSDFRRTAVLASTSIPVAVRGILSVRSFVLIKVSGVRSLNGRLNAPGLFSHYYDFC